MIKAILFDLDGVLLDTVDLHYQAFRQAIRLFGYDITPERHDESYNGLPTAEKLKLLTERLNLPRGLHRFLNEMKQRYTAELLETRVGPDSKITEILSSLQARGYRLGLASNCVTQTVERVLEQMQVSRFFEVALSRQMVSHGKPAPDLYLECFRRMQISPEEALIIEDSPPGVEAALAASPNVLVVKGPEEVQLPRILSFLDECEGQRHRQNGPIEIVIPMAGAGSRFATAGYRDPKPLIEVLGKPMIQWVIENLTPRTRPARFHFIVDKNHLERYALESLLCKLSPGCGITAISEKTQGAACSVMLATSQLPPHRPLLVANSDQYVDIDIDDFIRSASLPDTQGLIMSFPATESKWSYARTDREGWVCEVAEKRVISENATVGIYAFRSVREFNQAAEQMIAKNIRTNNEFYLCPVYNELIARSDFAVRLFPIVRSAMHGLGTPEDLTVFLQRFLPSEPEVYIPAAV